LCHAPSLMTVKNLSRLKSILYLMHWMRYFSLGERLVEFLWLRFSGFLVSFDIEQCR
jgi:hypothetical protein